MGNQFLKGLQRPAIMPEGSSLPDYSEAQDGDALIIEDGEPTWGAVDALPEIEETDEGKVLAVDQGEAVWADAPSGLPGIMPYESGRVLTVVPEKEKDDQIVPQQTLTITSEAVDVTGIDISALSGHDTITCVLDGIKYPATFYDLGGGEYEIYGDEKISNNTAFAITNGKFSVYTIMPYAIVAGSYSLEIYTEAETGELASGWKELPTAESDQNYFFINVELTMTGGTETAIEFSVDNCDKNGNQIMNAVEDGKILIAKASIPAAYMKISALNASATRGIDASAATVSFCTIAGYNNGVIGVYSASFTVKNTAPSETDPWGTGTLNVLALTPTNG